MKVSRYSYPLAALLSTLSSSSSSAAFAFVHPPLKPTSLVTQHNIGSISNSISNNHKHNHKQSHVKLNALPPVANNINIGSGLSNGINGINGISTNNLALPSVQVSVDTSALTQYFLETLISYGVPAFFWIVIIAFAAKAFRGSRKDAQSRNMGPNGNLFGASRNNVINELYSDLYGGSADDDKNKSPFSMFAAGPGSKNNIPKNLGIPKNQFLQITKLNDKYASFEYSLTAATQSKAKAAAQFRSQAFDSALTRAFDSSIAELNTAQKSDLLLEEKEFLKKGNEFLSSITALQTELTSLIIQEEMDNMDVEVGEVDAHAQTNNKDIIDATIVDESTDTSNVNATSTSTTVEEKKKDEKKSNSSNNKKEINKLVKEIEKQNTELLRLEMEFIRAVVETMGPVSCNNILLDLLFLSFTNIS